MGLEGHVHYKSQSLTLTKVHTAKAKPWRLFWHIQCLKNVFTNIYNTSVQQLELESPLAAITAVSLSG
jgi:hypothetical protein